MSVTVQRYLESYTEEMWDYERLCLFDSTETKAILRKRAHFERLLMSAEPHKADYLRYIEYEHLTNQLRWRRFERLIKKRQLEEGTEEFRELNTFVNKIQGQRFHALFRRTLHRFPADVDIWLQYVATFDSVGAQRAATRVFAEAIQKNPRSATLWIQAGAWHYNEFDDVSSARQIYLRALRLLPESKDLWLEYFKMELLCVEKYIQREMLAKLVESHEAELNGETVAVDIPTLDAEQEAGGDALLDIQAQVAQGEDNAFKRGELPLLVYRNAIQAIPKDLTFRERFLDTYRLFPRFTSGAEEVYADLLRDFPAEPRTYAIAAERHMAGVKEDTPEYVEALARLTAQLDGAVWQEGSAEDMYIEAHRSLVAHLNPELPEALQAYLTAVLLTWARHAVASRTVQGRYAICVTAWLQRVCEPTLRRWPAYLERAMDSTAATEAIEGTPIELALRMAELAVHVEPKNARAWLLRIRLTEIQHLNKQGRETRHAASDEEAPSDDNSQASGDEEEWMGDSGESARMIYTAPVRNAMLALYQKALREVPESVSLWKSYMKLLRNQGAAMASASSTADDQPGRPGTTNKHLTRAQLGRLFDEAIQLGSYLLGDAHAAVKPVIQSTYLSWAFTTGGLAYLRQVYRKLALTNVATPQLFLTCIAYERDNGNELDQIVELYEHLVRVASADPEIWLSYIGYLIDETKMDRVQKVYWQASKAVSDPIALETRYLALLDDKKS
ncbi:U3 snoRNP protein [Tieghemiomyces parasiticus]|uniref:U3 snoRNP protein n=1 Tax=Tieghemiomyces parasiticus TaxID=78921 RepID=A0A9W8DN94_9FUNG|nr:U3 snoRNP protein [Tieghemiomyces parasiticus]